MKEPTEGPAEVASSGGEELRSFELWKEQPGKAETLMLIEMTEVTTTDAGQRTVGNGVHRMDGGQPNRCSFIHLSRITN